MTLPRSGYYPAPNFPDTPIYDSLVAERGTPQIAPIRVPSPYDAGGHFPPALPSALPALPAGPSQHTPPPYGQQGRPQPALQQAPAPYIPPQAGGPRGYPGPQQAQQPRPAAPNGHEAMRPIAARPAAPRPNPAPYPEQYGRQHPGQGY